MYNSSGGRHWVKEETGTAGQSIRVDGNGGIFITGSYYDVNTGTGNDIRLIKYDYSGNMLWQKFYDFGNYEYGKLINIDSQSNIYITGYGAVSGGFFVGWLTSKYDSSGNLLWYNRFKENQSWEEYPYFASIGPQDEIYVTGNVGVVSGGTTYHGLETVRYNSDGSNPWVAEVNQYAGIGKGLVLGADQSLYGVGMFYYSVIKYSQSIPTGTEQTFMIPEKFNLEQNYPNPFNPSTKIRFSIPSNEFVALKIYNVLGSEITTLVNDNLQAGSYEVDFNSEGLTSGVYFYTLSTNNFTNTRKMILTK